VLLDDEGRVLLVLQNYGQRLWGIPGGAMEPGESPQEAAVREAREETGLEVELAHLVGVYTLRTQPIGLRFIFKATIRAGELIAVPNDEITEIRWWPVAALPPAMTRTAPHGIRDAAAGGRGIARDIWP
jgi:ADP-ribose pyrophosphatase YjhB (NUDIX family)